MTSPAIFRIVLQVGDLERATALYGTLLGAEGRSVGGGRVYFDCGGVILALLSPSQPPTPLPEDVYLAVDDVDAVHARARQLGVLSTETVHDAPAGEVVVRPWRERSFYACDPWGNGLCFVDRATVFTGRR